jgi:hypothetical protein
MQSHLQKKGKSYCHLTRKSFQKICFLYYLQFTEWSCQCLLYESSEFNCSAEILFAPVCFSAKSPFVAKFVEAEMKGNKHCHKTFGFAKVPLKKPSEFLRKNSRILPPCPKIGM